ncbi:MAG: DUF4091 domain-containing protein [Sphaerochaeta sp.]
MYEFHIVDALEKVFPDTRPRPMAHSHITSLQGGKVSFQLAYFLSSDADADPSQYFTLSLTGAPGAFRLRDVQLVPSDLPALSQRDTGYLRTDPSLYPDLLTPSDGTFRPIAGQWRSIFVDLKVPEQASGDFSLVLEIVPQETLTLGNGQVVNKRPSVQGWKTALSLTVVPALLPRQELLVTQWFHADCLANYYGCAVFSEQYWDILASFIRFAGKEARMNMLLTPVFTPPLDTVVGGERTTVQLVGISKSGETYQFSWDNLRRWCALCRDAGISHLEIAHLFTQWGAQYTPKIMVKVDGKEQQLFGWHVAATDPSYRSFLEAFLPALIAVLKEEGYDRDQLRFHISDEPNLEQLPDYLLAKKQVADLLEGYTIMDALSNYEFYEQGVVEHPVPANDHIGPFLENKVPNLWVYYCVAQSVDVPNRFFSMPSSRNRIMGILMYLYAIEGFLHWGYNFYNSQYSRTAINPYQVTDCGKAFPSGDAFIVYPGEGGTVYSSLRNEVQTDGFEDMQCLSLLEKLTSRSFVVSLIHEGLSYQLQFNRYPLDSSYLLRVRERCLEEIAKRC